jgi:hypothetical protein
MVSELEVLRRAVGSELFTQVTALRGSCSSVEELALRGSYMTVAGSNKLDGLWFETWSRPFRRGVVDYCSLVVWQVGSFGGLAESSVCNSMLCGGLPTPWMDF